MTIEEAIQHRSSVRQFLDKPIREETLKKIMQLAQKAPSWINAQETQVYITTGKTLATMRKIHQTINDDPNRHTKSDLPYVSIKDWDSFSQKNMHDKVNLTHQMFGTDTFNKMNHQHSDHLFNAQAVVYLTLPKNYNDWMLMDLGMLTQTIMLAAQAYQVDSIPAFEFVKYPNHLRKAMQVPNSRVMALGIGLGYADKKDPINTIHPKRVNLDQMLHIKK